MVVHLEGASHGSLAEANIVAHELAHYDVARYRLSVRAPDHLVFFLWIFRSVAN